jgi:Zn-finger nucleic acid-binding protein
VNVDECYGCGGFFLDSGELREVRENHMSDEERDAYVQKLLDDVPEYAAMKEETRQLRAKAGRRFGNILRGTLFLPIP